MWSFIKLETCHRGGPWCQVCSSHKIMTVPKCCWTFAEDPIVENEIQALQWLGRTFCPNCGRIICDIFDIFAKLQYVLFPTAATRTVDTSRVPEMKIWCARNDFSSLDSHFKIAGWRSQMHLWCWPGTLGKPFEYLCKGPQCRLSAGLYACPSFLRLLHQIGQMMFLWEHMTFHWTEYHLLCSSWRTNHEYLNQWNRCERTEKYLESSFPHDDLIKLRI